MVGMMVGSSALRHPDSIRPARGRRRSRCRRHSILLVCDFFYPRLGGVEMHIWSLAQCLLRRGHKVIVLTHAYAPGGRAGIRHMTNGLKVYYAPLMIMADQCALPLIFGLFPMLRDILIRERIDIIHGHQATSAMMHEALLHAGTMGLRVCYTDHSLFGFADAASINVNKLLRFSLSALDHAICVSHVCRENLVLRAGLDPSRVSTIPNAVDPSRFVPDPSKRPGDAATVNIVIMSRLVYRKGVDLVVRVIPEICERFPHVHFIVGGDGPKALLLQEMRERYQLQDRVEMLGAVPHARVRDVLVRGHIFLNSSLTESFCIAILEAACCGLFVVSTRVGGVPEVLPPDMILFAEPTVASLVDAVSDAIPLAHTMDPEELHRRVARAYSWDEVAARTEVVYDGIMDLPRPALAERLAKYRRVGPFAGLLCMLFVAIDHLVWQFLKWWRPAHTIDIAPDFHRGPDGVEKAGADDDEER